MAVVRAIALLDDGSLVSVGHYILSIGNFYLKKVLPSGKSDSSFGTNGIVVDAAGKDAMAVSVQADGKILASGYDFSYNAIISRYNVDGSRDVSFGYEGATRISIPGWSGSIIKDMALLENGQILASLHGIYSGQVGVAKINIDGTLDQSFAENGKFLKDAYSPFDWTFVKIQSDGKVILGSTTAIGNDWDFFALRLNSDGSVDNTFGTAGFFGDTGYAIQAQLGNQHARSLIVDNSNNIFIAGSSQPLEIDPYLIANNVNVPRDFFVSKLTPDGQLDMTFGNNNGMISFDLGGADTCQAFVVQTDGKIVLAGMSIIDGVDYLALVRLNHDGSLDNSFGSNGKVLVSGLDLDAYWFEVTDVETSSDGEIIAAFTTGKSSFALAFSPDGKVNRGYLLGTEVSDSFSGTQSNDILFGYSGNDNLNGGNGNDYISGGSGDDAIYGGSGSDTADYSDTTGGVTVDLNAGTATGDGTDSLFEIENATGGSGNDILTANDTSGSELIGGGGADTLDGGDSADILYGGDGNDTVDAGAGNDLIIGGDGAGNDTYIGGSGVDTVKYTSALAGITVNLTNGTATSTVGSDAAGIGTDSLSGIENIIAGNYDDSLTGSNVDNVITGESGNDTINGGDGTDTAVYEGNQSDYIITNNNNGTWTIQDKTAGRDGTDTLSNIERIKFANNLYIISASNVINGTAKGEVLDGTNAGDLIYGLGGNDTLNGLDGDDLLDGGTGNDSMFGGAGDDIYIVNSTSDRVYETTTVSSNINAGGNDTVQSSVSWTLGSYVENLTLTGSAAVNATGNSLNNRLIGNSGANVLNGSGGGDTMLGGLGNDTYVVDSLSDVITENSAEGTDLVQVAITTASGTYTLGDNIENATLTNTVAYNLTGNNLSNTLTGNTAANTLDGGAGVDILRGGAGNDTYIVDIISATGALQDTVTESANSGNDTIELRGSYVGALANITLSANFENLDISSTSSSLYNLIGNKSGNTLTGNSANNSLSGLAGADILIGGGGNDRLIGGASNDILRGDGGSDTFVFAAGDSGRTVTTLDAIQDFTKGVLGTGDVIDFSVVLSKGGSNATATSSNASINNITAVATFAGGSGVTLEDAIADIATRFTSATNASGEFAFFKVNNTGDYYMFISDGVAGVTNNDVLVQLVGISSINSIDLTNGDLTILS